MNKKKTTAKGFTLIELIIVLAIFSVIMTLVMSFIDPVSKVMSKTSIKERTSAYVDNIGEYISKSIRHAQNINVYERGLIGGTEQELVRDFVDTYYDGAIDDTLASLKGKVHVIKLINDTVVDGADTLEAGKIYESVYNFTSGMGKPTKVYFDTVTNTYVPDGTVPEAELESDERYTPFTKILYDDAAFKHSSVSPVTLNKQVINDEHFKDYCYYYQLGMYTFDPITNPTEVGLTEDTNAKFFYSRLNRMLDSSNTAISDSVNEYQFVMNVVSFNNEQDDTGAFVNKINASYTIGEGDSAVTENFTAFRSPAAMSSVGMTFKNVQMQKESKSVKYYRKKLNGDGTVATKDGQEIIEAVTNNLGAAPFKRISSIDPVNIGESGEIIGDGNNIYMIFTVPAEINDTEWNFS